MKKGNGIHKSPRMFRRGGRILGQLLACKPTIFLVYPVIERRGTEMAKTMESYTRKWDGREKRSWLMMKR